MHNRHGRWSWICVLVVLCMGAGAWGQVRLNEFMASNDQTLLDLTGQADDWIEIANTSNQAVDLAGYYLTDDPNEPQQWQFPLDQSELTVIPRKGYLIVWADNDVVEGELHANFKLSASGEALALVATDGQTLLDSLEFPSQQEDVSFGRHPDDESLWVYMDEPTPMQANATGYLGDVDDTEFSVDRGFYDNPITVMITCDTIGASIVYTLDGSDPATSSSAQTYTAPLTINSTTCLRAYATKSGWRPSNVDTQTYLFVDDIIAQTHQQALAAGYPSQWTGYTADYGMDPEITESGDYRDLMEEALTSLPVISVVTDKDHLFGSQTGIYTHPEEEASDSDKLEWERPASAELFTLDGSLEFQLNCGVRLQGGHSRKPEKSPKHAFSLRFRSLYGPSKLNCKLFGEDWPVDSFDTLHLRAGFCNNWIHHQANQRERAQHIRDQWMHDAMIDMGNQDGLQGIYVHLYLNGLYWGVYCLHERPDADHYAAYHGVDADLVDAVNGDPTYVISDPLNSGSVSDGSIEAWLELQNVVARGNWTAIQEQMDVDSFIDWMILNYYAGITDIKRGTNWRAAGGGVDRLPWHFYSWDAEHVIEELSQSGIGSEDDPSGLFGYLMTVEGFQMRFADRLRKHLYHEGALTAENNITRWEARSDEIQLAMIAESARWGDYRRDVHSYAAGPYNLYTVNDYWLPERERILEDYFPYRTNLVRNHMVSRGWYPDIDTPEFDIDGTAQHGGQLEKGQLLSMRPTNQDIVYTLEGSDPLIIDGDDGGDLFSAMLIETAAEKHVWVPTSNIGTGWRQRTFDDSSWIDGTPVNTSASGGVGYEMGSGYEDGISYDVLNQMFYAQTSCYIRIPFTASQSDLDRIDSLNLRVLSDDGFVAFLNGVEVASINAPTSLSWNSNATGSQEADDWLTFNISDALGELQVGDNVLAVQALNRSTDSSDFLFSTELIGQEGGGSGELSPAAQWYSQAITLDHSVVVKARSREDGDWSALTEAVYGVGPVADSLRITALMYHPSDPNAEFIKLTNIGSESINLNLVSFTRGVRLTLGDVELASGASTYVVRDQATFEATYGTSVDVAGEYQGNLDNGGERITLEDAVGTVILDFRYEDDWYPSTDGDGQFLEIRNPHADPDTWSDPLSWQED